MCLISVSQPYSSLSSFSLVSLPILQCPPVHAPTPTRCSGLEIQGHFLEVWLWDNLFLPRCSLPRPLIHHHFIQFKTKPGHQRKSMHLYIFKLSRGVLLKTLLLSPELLVQKENSDWLLTKQFRSLSTLISPQSDSLYMNASILLVCLQHF